jgi:Holliday junction DNA helicase RuvA
MYAYIKGDVTFRSPTFVVLETGGVGYHIHIPLSTFSWLEGKDQVMLYTHFQVREDAHTLYGFGTQAERNLFIALLGVTGVGATTAQLILSSMSVDEVRAAVIGEQAQLLQKVKGIGAKTAKQIILDLKDKLQREAGGSPVILPTGGYDVREEALSGLMALGFNRATVQKAVQMVFEQDPGVQRVEEVIKRALKALAN